MSLILCCLLLAITWHCIHSERRSFYMFSLCGYPASVLFLGSCGLSEQVISKLSVFCSLVDQDVRYTAVSSFIFLRFFAPAILSPNLFHLRPHHPVSLMVNPLTPSAGVSKIRPGGQNRSSKDPSLTHWTTLENVKGRHGFGPLTVFFLIVFTAFPTNKDLHHCLYSTQK